MIVVAQQLTRRGLAARDPGAAGAPRKGECAMLKPHPQHLLCR